MKKICAVLGLALLMGCAKEECPRKDKGCGKGLTNQEVPIAEQKEVAQEAVPTLEDVTPSK